MFKFSIFTNEITRKYRGLLIWGLSILGYSLLMVAFADSIISQAEGLKAFLDALGPGILALVGSDAETFTTFAGYYVGEFATFGLLLSAIYAAFVGANAVGKEIRDRSLALVKTRPTSRSSIFISKYLANASMFIFGYFIIALINYIAALLFVSSAEFGIDLFINVFVSMAIFTLLFYTIGFSAAIFVGDNMAIGIGAGLSIMGLMLNFVKSIKEVPEQVQYLNPFFYIDLGLLSRNDGLSSGLIVLLIITVIAFGLGLWQFNRRDLHI